MRRNVKIALAVPAAVVALLALAEIGARIAWREKPVAGWRSHPLVGGLRAPRFKANKVAIDTSEPFVYETNELCLRSTTLNEVEKKPGVYRIVFVGGSTTENGDLPHEHTFPGIVEKALAASAPGGRRFEVGNASVPGATTNVVVAQLIHRVLPLSPDLVVCLDPVLNDLHDSLKDVWDPAMSYLAADLPTPRFMDWLSAQSHLLGHFNTRNAEPANAREMLAQRVKARREKEERDPPPEILARGRPHHERMQRIFLEICRDEKVACALVTEPILLKPNMSAEEKNVVASTAITRSDWNLKVETELAGLEAYNATTRKNALAFGAILIDAAAAVPKDLAHYVDDVHLTTKGNEVIAKAVLEGIAPVLSR